MSSLKRIWELLNGDEDIPISGNYYGKEYKYDYPISNERALEIANDKLTKVYMNSWNDGMLTYVSIHFKIDGILNKNNREYYCIKATSGDISGIDKDTLWDGEISKIELSKLKCLVDVNNGNYIYINDKSIE